MLRQVLRGDEDVDAVVADHERDRLRRCPGGHGNTVDGNGGIRVMRRRGHGDGIRGMCNARRVVEDVGVKSRGERATREGQGGKRGIDRGQPRDRDCVGLPGRAIGLCHDNTDNVIPDTQRNRRGCGAGRNDHAIDGDGGVAVCCRRGDRDRVGRVIDAGRVGLYVGRERRAQRGAADCQARETGSRRRA